MHLKIKKSLTTQKYSDFNDYLFPQKNALALFGFMQRQ